ncbi:hypothetical protein NDU88_009822 [Pleurodeles waltl]|uniref:Uncharacterized protein n=1 Tax=Pleurodeles waltl TaxID=8319 RepID=A0AAV7PW80_PLEWA|nr:hypothetical protein NDU88_009822 [Pleurodeles waltl]
MSSSSRRQKAEMKLALPRKGRAASTKTRVQVIILKISLSWSLNRALRFLTATKHRARAGQQLTATPRWRWPQQDTASEEDNTGLDDDFFPHHPEERPSSRRNDIQKQAVSDSEPTPRNGESSTTRELGPQDGSRSKGGTRSRRYDLHPNPEPSQRLRDRMWS